MEYTADQQKVLDTVHQAHRNGSLYYTLPFGCEHDDIDNLSFLAEICISERAYDYIVHYSYPCSYGNIKWKRVPDS